MSANRSVLLPADGHYVLTVEPAIHRVVGTQIGGVSFGYVGVIEEQPWPAASPLTPSTPPVATTVDGTLLDTQHNFRELSVSGPSAVVITARVFGADTTGVLMVFRRDGGFMGEAPLELDHEHGEYRALYPLPASQRARGRLVHGLGHHERRRHRLRDRRLGHASGRLRLAGAGCGASRAAGGGRRRRAATP